MWKNKQTKKINNNNNEDNNYYYYYYYYYSQVPAVHCIVQSVHVASDQ